MRKPEATGDALFVEGDYAGAVAAYTVAIEVGGVHNVKFVPFSLEAGGVWGPAAKKFFKQCASQADNQDRDVDLYHWSSAKFESTWRDTISVLVARGRAQVGVHSAKSDWSRRILDFAYMDYDDQAAHHE